MAPPLVRPEPGAFLPGLSDSRQGSAGSARLPTGPKAQPERPTRHAPNSCALLRGRKRWGSAAVQGPPCGWAPCRCWRSRQPSPSRPPPRCSGRPPRRRAGPACRRGWAGPHLAHGGADHHHTGARFGRPATDLDDLPRDTAAHGLVGQEFMGADAILGGAEPAHGNGGGAALSCASVEWRAWKRW